MCDNQIIVLFNAENRDSPVCAKSGVLKLECKEHHGCSSFP
jgi:hypothetical protein